MGSGRQLADLIYRVRCKCIDKHEVVREKVGLSPAEFKCICDLNIDDELTASEFAEKVELSISRSSRVIDKMAKNGYLKVDRNRNDKRLVTISLATKGRALKREIENDFDECNSRLEEALDETERAEIKQVLEKLLSVI